LLCKNRLHECKVAKADYQTAGKYWNKLKERLKKEESESVTKCNRLKMKAADEETKADKTKTG
jgi:hypothetical protein